MVEHELLLLGLLKSGPKHGYEIKKLIEEDLKPLLGIKLKSIYYPLNKMESLGYLKKDVGSQGRGPEKYVYKLTAKGQSIFERKVAESFRAIERPYFNLNLSLYFLQYVDKKIAKHQLKTRVMLLKRIKREIEGFSKEVKNTKRHLKIIFEHDLDLVQAEIDYITRLMEALP